MTKNICKIHLYKRRMWCNSKQRWFNSARVYEGDEGRHESVYNPFTTPIHHLIYGVEGVEPMIKLVIFYHWFFIYIFLKENKYIKELCYDKVDILLFSEWLNSNTLINYGYYLNNSLSSISIFS